MTAIATALTWEDYFVIGLAVALTIVALVTSGLLIWLSRTVGSLKKAVDTLTGETVVIMRDVDQTVKGVNQEIERVDSIMASAQSVAKNAETISETVKLAITNPLVKVLAFIAGARRGAKKFREE